MTEEDEISKQELLEEEKPIDQLAESIKQKKSAKRKKQIKTGGILFVVLLLGYFVYSIGQPGKGSANYGICLSFLELNLPYPHTLRVSEAIYKSNGTMLIWYTFIDAFGEYRMEPFECRLLSNPETGKLELTESIFNKISMSKDKIASLNHALPYFAANPYEPDYPSKLPDDITALKGTGFYKHRIDNISKR